MGAGRVVRPGREVLIPFGSREVAPGDATGRALYALAGQDLWFSVDSGTTWKHRWHFDRGDLIALVVDPKHPGHLYAGFFLPAEVLYSTDDGSSWRILTD